MRTDQETSQRGADDAGQRQQALLQRHDPTHVLVACDARCQSAPCRVRHRLTTLEQHHQSVGAPTVFEGCKTGAGERLHGRRDQQDRSRVEPVRDQACDTHREDGGQSEGDHQQRDTRGAAALVVHPQGERDHRERVPDQRDSQGRDDQPQVSVSPDRRPTVALTTNYRKELLHVYERIASQSDGSRPIIKPWQKRPTRRPNGPP